MTKLIIVLGSICFCYQSFAQISKTISTSHTGTFTIKGDYYSEYNNLKKAVKNYSNSIRRNPNDRYAMLKIADAFHRSDELELADQWYHKAFSSNSDIKLNDLLDYISLLAKRQKYEDIKRWTSIYNNKIKTDSSGSFKDSMLVFTKNLESINSSQSDVVSTVYKDQLIFSSNRSSDSDDYDLYQSVRMPDSKYATPAPFVEHINSATNEMSLTIVDQKGQFFYTKTDSSQSNMEVLFGPFPFKSDNKSEIKKMTIRKFDYEIGHPTFNKAGTVVIFSAKNQKNDSGFDLYKSEINGNKWSKPIKLTSRINSKGEEMYPHLYKDSVLYFASNGHEGYGGLDIYKVNLYNENAPLTHLYEPINSTYDDFGLFISDSDEHYLSSNRPYGLGNDDIYQVYPIFLLQKLTNVEDESSNEKFPIYTSSGDVIRLTGSANENLEFTFRPGMDYKLNIHYDDYKEEKTSQTFSSIDIKKDDRYTFYIQKFIKTNVDKDEASRNRVQDIHVNPGDLITFEIIPITPSTADSIKSKIRFNNSDVVINNQDTLVFSYIPEESAPTDDVVKDVDLIVASFNDLTNKDERSDKLATIATLTPETTLPDSEDLSTPEPSKDDPEVEMVLADQKEELNKNVQVVLNEDTKSLENSIAKDTLKIDEATIGQAEEIPKDVPDNKTAQPTEVVKADLTESILSSDTLSNELVSADKQETETTQPQPIIDNNLNKNPEPKETLRYRVQIAAAITEISEKELKRIYSGPKTVHLFQVDQYFKYYIGETPSYKEAKNTLEASDVDDAFIVPYRGEYTLNLKNAVAAQNSNVQNPLESGIQDHQDINPTMVNEKPSKTLVQGEEEDVAKDTTITETADAIAAFDQIREEELAISDSIILAQEESLSNSDLIKATTTTETVAAPTQISKEEVVQVNDSLIIAKEENVPENESIKDTIDVGEDIKNATTISALSSEESTSDLVVASANQVIDSTEIKQPVNPEAHEVKNEAIDVLQYRVQIAAARSEISDPILNRIYNGPKKISRFREDGYYKYYIAEERNYYTARRILNKCGVENAFIAAYKGNSKWNLKEAIASQYKEPIIQRESFKDSILTIVSINFKLNETDLLASETTKLQKIIQQLKINSSSYAIVNGYMDNTRNRPYNYGVLKERASIVQKFILDKDILSSQVKTQYFGESLQLKYCNDTDSCNDSNYQTNRRVEVLLFTPKE